MNPKIIYTKSYGIGAYSLLHNEIYIHPGLLDYPELHHFVLNHEIGHATKDKNILDAIKRDFKDNKTIFELERFKEFKHKNKIGFKRTVLFYWVMISYNIGSLPNVLLTEMRYLTYKVKR